MASNFPHPPPLFSTVAPTGGGQTNSTTGMSPTILPELSTASLAQEMTLMAKNMAHMQGAISTLLQNQNAVQTIPVLPAIPSTALLTHGLTHQPPNNPVSIPALFAPPLPYNVVSRSAPHLQLFTAAMLAYPPVFMLTSPSVPYTIANPTSVPTLEPCQAETFV